MTVETELHQEEVVLEFRGVSFAFDGKTALDDVSFVLRRGRMLCVTGLSGSGKSVLVRLAIGLLQPDEGQVLIQGHDINQLTESEFLRLLTDSVGVVFQDSSLFTGMSALENAEYCLAEQGRSDEDVERIGLEVLRFVGLESDSEKLPEELSIGMGRRLEFARALAGWPRVLLLDEPSAGLDPINARKLLDLVIQARDVHRVSTLIVTKALWEIRYLAGHRTTSTGSEQRVSSEDESLLDETDVLVLEDGRVRFVGSARQFQTSEVPAVQRLTVDARSSRNPPPKDPWAYARRNKSRLF